MAFGRTANPALSDKVFQRTDLADGESMTLSGAVNKSFILIALVFLGAFVSWRAAYPDGWSPLLPPRIPSWYVVAAFAGFIVGLVLIFNRRWSPLLAPVYAVLEGLSLGGISAAFEARYPGIVGQAVLCTMGTFVALLTAYRARVIPVTENFKLGIAAATGGICFVYIIDIVLMLFGMRVPFLHETGPLGIGISVFIVAVAALNLVLDFDFIERGAESGAPKYMEWYSAFGLIVTLVWLYVEILRLLSKLKQRN